MLLFPLGPFPTINNMTVFTAPQITLLPTHTLLKDPIAEPSP